MMSSQQLCRRTVTRSTIVSLLAMTVALALADVALGVDAVRQLAKAHFDLPADRLPVAADCAELRQALLQ